MCTAVCGAHLCNATGALAHSPMPLSTMFSLGTAESHAEGFNAGEAATVEHDTDRQRAVAEEKL